MNEPWGSYSIDYEDFFKVNVALGLQLYLLKHVVEYRKVHCKMHVVLCKWFADLMQLGVLNNQFYRFTAYE